MRPLSLLLQEVTGQELKWWHWYGIKGMTMEEILKYEWSGLVD